MKSFVEFLNEGINDPAIFKAIFVAGGAGSGKSFIAEKSGLKALGLRPVNSDDALELFLKNSKMSMKLNTLTKSELSELQKIRDKAKDITKNKLDILLEGKIGLIIDSTAKDYTKIAKQKIGLEEIGYDTYMIFVNTSLETAKKRNSERPRSVPDDILTKTWEGAQNNIGKFQNLFGVDNIVIVDNDDINSTEKITTKVYKRIKKFINKPVSNYKAKEWMRLQKIVKN